MDTTEQLLDAWDIHCRINGFLLDAIAPEALSSTASHGGRSVAAIFAHMHGVRVQWAKVIAPVHAEGLNTIPTRTKKDKAALMHDLLREAHTASAATMRSILGEGFTNGTLKNYKPHPAAFMGYLIAHESYHRGEIGIILTQAGHPLEGTTAYAMWDWNEM